MTMTPAIGVICWTVGSLKNEPELFEVGVARLIYHGKNKNRNYDYDNKRTAAYDKCDNSPEPEIFGAAFEL
jgi:hypothetical protein